MNFDFNFYALVLIILGSFTFLISCLILSNKPGTLRWIGFLILSNSIWSVSYGLELASTSQISWLTGVQYLGITSLPLSWFLFSMDVAGHEKWIRNRGNLFLASIVPIITLVLVWTNDFHHLHYKSTYLVPGPPYSVLHIERGISYYFFVAYFYALLLLSNFFLIRKFSKSDPIYRKQNQTILIGAALPWITNIIYVFNLVPLYGLDLTPFAFLISTLLITISIYKFRLFDIQPIAREKILELMQDGFVVFDDNLTIIDYNNSFKKHFGMPSEMRLSGKLLSTVLSDQPELLEKIRVSVPGKQEIQILVNQRIQYMEADLRILNENKLNRHFTIIRFQDITTLRLEALKTVRQANELQKLNQLKDRIFSIMAHDLRGPLLNLSEVLKMNNDELISPEEFKSLSPALARDIVYTTDLLDNILHWSRSQLNGYGINRECFNLKRLIDSERNYHQKAANLKEITILTDVAGDLIVFADLLMMQIVIRNLIANAIKFCSSGCTIRISAANEVQFIALHIIDNGIGIDSDNLEKIRNQENISSRGTRNEKGTGIGLMVCWDFMAKNGGSIRIDSKRDEGTTFSLKIPKPEA